MPLVWFGLFLFLGVHSTRIFADNWRSKSIERMGVWPWKASYSILSLLGLGILVVGYKLVRPVQLYFYFSYEWSHLIAVLLTLPAFELLAAAYVPGTRIKRAVKHPMLLAVILWSLAHLLANGRAVNVLVFGAFLLWSLVLYWVSYRRDRAQAVAYAVGPVTRDVIAVLVGTVAWLVFVFWLHQSLVGVKPINGLGF